MKTEFVKAGAVLSILLAGCSGGSSSNSQTQYLPVPSSVLSTAPSNYSISGFAQTSGSLEPDDIVQAGNNVFVVVQDKNVNPDGTLATGVTSAQSKLYKYDLNGNLVASYNLPGHPDGMTQFDSNTLWISSNEDANPLIVVFNISAGSAKIYSSDVATLPHGGGLDDLKVVNGVVYASGSNPTTAPTAQPATLTYSTDSAGTTAVYGVSSGPALYAVALNSDGVTFHSTPALMSNTTVNSVNLAAPILLNVTDADSTAIDPSGNLVLSSQQDSELVFVSNIGTASQSVSVVNMTLYGNPWPLDDTRWVPAAGAATMLVADAPAKMIYRIVANGGFTPKTAYSAGQGTVLQSDTSTGIMTPIFTGMNNPHGLIFLSN